VTSAEMGAALEVDRRNPVPDHERVEDRRAAVEAQLGGPLADRTTAETRTLGERPALWIRPTEEPGQRTILYLHGGAYEVGSPSAYRSFSSKLAVLLRATVVVPDYRLAPEHVFPAAVDDALAAYRELLDRVPAMSLALVGDSAGGGLVLATLLAAQREGLPQPASATALSAWTDLTVTADSVQRCAATDPFIPAAMLRRAATAYLAGADPLDPLASPVHASRDELGSLAPLLLQAAANEVLADDSITMTRRINDAGGQATLDLCPEAFHVWILAGDDIPESRHAIDTLVRFVNQHWE
jgi:monoterpene epsilon-lactone hydrolase